MNLDINKYTGFDKKIVEEILTGGKFNGTVYTTSKGVNSIYINNKKTFLSDMLALDLKALKAKTLTTNNKVLSLEEQTKLEEQGIL